MNTNKRTFRENLQYVLIWLLFIWVSCLVSILIDLLLVKLVTSIVGDISYMTGAVLHVVFMALGAAAPLGAISYLISYHLGEFSSVYSAVEGIAALILQLLCGLLLGFPVWITGGVKGLAGLMEYGSRLFGDSNMNDIALRYYLLAFLLFGVFYLIVKYVCGFLGRHQRIKLRIELTGSPVKPTERDSDENE